MMATFFSEEDVDFDIYRQYFLFFSSGFTTMETTARLGWIPGPKCI